MSMIASIASFTTILCAALLASCGPAATHARTTTPLLRGGLDASIPPAHTSSYTSISSTSISVVGADDAYTLINGERLLRDPTCFTRPRKGRRRCACLDLPAMFPSRTGCLQRLHAPPPLFTAADSEGTSVTFCGHVRVSMHPWQLLFPACQGHPLMRGFLGSLLGHSVNKQLCMFYMTPQAHIPISTPASRVQRLFKRAGSAAQGSGAGFSMFSMLLARGAGFWSPCASQHAIEDRNIFLTTLSQQTCHRVHCQCLDQALSRRAMRRHPGMSAVSCLGAALCRRSSHN